MDTPLLFKYRFPKVVLSIFQKSPTTLDFCLADLNELNSAREKMHPIREKL